MRIKDLFRSKTFWTGLAMVGYGAFHIATGNYDEGIQSVLNGLAFIFLRSAIGKEK